MGILRNVLGATTNENIAKIIQGSAILSQDDLTFLYRTPGSAGNRKKYSISVWCRKNSNFSDDATVSESTIAAAGTWTSGNQLDELDLCAGEGTHSGSREKGSPHFSGGVYGISTQYNYGVYNANRDGVGWQHYYFTIDTDAAAADRIKVWVNGEAGSLKRTGSYPTVSSGRSMMWNNNSGTGVGCFDGYVCEFYHMDGTVDSDASRFGFLDPETNQWRPKVVEISDAEYGTCGFYLPLDGQTAVGADQSGKGNDWTSQGGTINFSPESPSGISGQVDTNAGITTTGYPTSYCTLDFTAYEMSTCADRKEGGLYSRIENSGTITGHPIGEFAVSSGKWYYEWIWVSTTDSAAWCSVANPNTAYTNGKLNNHWKLRGSGGERQYWIGGVKQEEVNTSADWSTGDTIGVAIDMDEGKWYVSTNGTWQDAGNGAGDPVNGTGYVHNNIKSAGTGTVIPMWGTDGGSTTCVMRANFGQKPFGYAAPKGFLPMCVANLPSTESVLPGQHFKPVKYTGNTSGNLAVSGVGFKPDLLWIKHLEGTDSWEAEDSVRGAGNRLILNSNGGQSTPGSQWNVVSFDADGFTVGSGPSECNRNAQAHVSYSWKAGGSSGTFNVDGKAFASAADAGLDGGSVSPTGASVGTKSGLSVLEFTATGANMTIAHGLEKAPEFVIAKGIYDWGTYHSYLGGTKAIWMNEKNVTTSSDIWQDTAPTSSVVSLGTNVNVNNNTSPTVLYSWHSVPGLSKFGSYCGTGNAKGQNIFCGFKPALVIIKDVSNDSWDWYAVDSARDTYNTVTHTIYPSQNYAEDNSTDYNSFDFTASGFKVRGKPSNSEPTNNDGEIYVYAAWADTPLNNAYGVVATGR
jgi:hypothetical protein